MSVTAEHDYWSVDSAPKQLTQPLPLWAAPAVLGLFTVFSSGLLLAITRIEVLAAVFPARDIVFSPYLGTHSIPLRLFILAFYAAFCAIVGATPLARLRLLLELVIYYVLVCGFFDLINVAADRWFGFVYSLHIVEILSGLFGFFIFSTKLLDHGSMPRRAATPLGNRYKLSSTARIAVATLLAMGVSLWIDSLDMLVVRDLRQIALLGGTGPGVFLFLPALFLILYVLGTAQLIWRRGRGGIDPVTVIVPAHNESHVLPRTMAAIAEAAQAYRGEVKVLILNNCSTDGTGETAATELARYPALAGRVIDVPEPGKAHALNRGIVETDTDFVIRIDADTQIGKHSIRRAMQHFADPHVGVVGGLPLAPGGGLFDRARNLETLLKHGYYQVAYGAVDGIVGVPGMFAAYRTRAVRAVGGFVSGMNGEDTDASLRIGEAGYRIVGDPSAVYVSEVPKTLRHLREQRMRWFRSIYHVCARNRDYLDGPMVSARGKIILPFMLLNSGRRAMTVPLVIFGAINLALLNGEPGTLTVQAVLAVILGAPAIMAAFAALANGRAWALIGIPEYIVFRQLRSYLTLESLLSIAHDKADRRDAASDLDRFSVKQDG